MWDQEWGLEKHCSFNRILLQKLSIQNNFKQSIAEKWKTMAKNLTWNSIRLAFVKKTCMPNPIKSFEYITCYNLNNLKPIKIPSNFIRNSCQKISKTWNQREYQKKRLHFFRWSIILLITRFTKILLTTTTKKD